MVFAAWAWLECFDYNVPLIPLWVYAVLGSK